MNARTSKLLFDVLESGRSIRGWCTGRSYAAYEQDRQFRRAVEREFEIIGEALKRLSQADPEVAERIRNYPGLSAFETESSTATTPWTTPWSGV
jgi:uncharacterized protein with HEPN domain